MHDVLKARKDVLTVKVSLADRTAVIEHMRNLDPVELVGALNEKHLGASLQEHGSAGSRKRPLKTLLIGIGKPILQLTLFCVGCAFHLAGVGGWVVPSVLFGACITLSYNLFFKSYLAILRRQANVEIFMSIAIVGSLAQQDLLEAALVGTLVTLMDTVTLVVVEAVDRRLNNSISLPAATIPLAGGTSIPAADLKEGMVFLVRAGDVVPSDGTVLKGRGAVDEARLTGEALPVFKEAGANVSSGSVLQSGFLEVTATADVDASFLSRTLQSVQQAKNTLSGTQLVVGKCAAWYTPTVLLIAVVAASIRRDLQLFLVIIVAGCPCALLGAAPFSQAAALAVLANKHGLLLKETSTLESLARLRWLGLDKTGTLTTGRFELVDMKSVSSYDIGDLHLWAASVETLDNHPLARSLVVSYTGCVASFAGWDGLPAVTKFKREGRNGVRGVVDGKSIGVGNLGFLHARDIILEGEADNICREWSSLGTVLFITVENEVAGVLLLQDPVKGDAQESVAQLRALGVDLSILTGDTGNAAARVAEATGIKDLHIGLLPEDKARLLIEASWSKEAAQSKGVDPLLGQEQRGPLEVGFVGDGLNDCLALASAHCGIVMQEVGSQATIDAASAVLQGSFGQLPAAIIVARRTQRLVIANIALALCINAGIIAVAVTVGLPLWVSIVADTGSLLAVLLNSLWPLCWCVEPVPDTGAASNGVSGFISLNVA